MGILKYIKTVWVFAAILVFPVSCDKMLETEPRTSISDEVALEDLEGINATIIGLYSRMASTTYYGRDFTIAGELMADQAKVSLTGSRFRNHPANREGAGFYLWNHIYDNINRANLILHYIDDVDAPREKINQLKGETYFIRALFHFDLVRVYARSPLYQEPLVRGRPLGVIIRTKPFRGIDHTTFASRSEIDECYDQVESDLLESIYYFDDNLKDFPYRANELAARALLARVWLYRGKWEQARDMALEVIAEAPRLSRPEEYKKVFAGIPGFESIFELFYSESNRQHTNNSIAGVALRTAEEHAGYGEVIFRQDLLDQFESGDVRKEMTVEFNKDGEDVVYQTKYAGHKGQHYWDDIPIIRTSEMYLILAEAYWENEQYDEAREVLNYLRENRGLDQIVFSDVPDEEFINAILNERRVELCWEHSHRWFDLRRRGMDIPKGVPDVDEGEPLLYEDYRVVDRISRSGEAEVNPNLIQNPGY